MYFLSLWPLAEVFGVAKAHAAVAISVNLAFTALLPYARNFDNIL